MSATSSKAAVYVQTNEPTANRVIAFRRADDGSLMELGATGREVPATAFRI